MKRIWALLLCLCLLLPAASGLALEEDGLPFAIRSGSRDEARIAITVDDCFDLPMAAKIFELVQELGVRITYFPLGCQLRDEDADMWRAIAASDCEIGTHTYGHFSLADMEPRGIISALGRSQEALDRVLGYHYQIRCLRPPYGTYTDQSGSSNRIRHAIKTYGFNHVVNWDVSQTDPDIAIKKVQNGSILLYHARPADYECLAKLIPELLEKGYELVTVSELLGFGPLETSDEPYVYDRTAFYQ